ncbi:MAG: hypothetical protein JHC95_06295 [Solirubrobacteraceae bacterium]|nr:hypothetical protein [Solirubrobacteraceae bacterium]
MPTTPITIRPAMPADAAALRNLAALDGRPPLRGPAIIAEARGRAIAAIALDDGAVAADPMRRTAGPVTLLRTQRELLRSHHRGTANGRLSFPRLRAA